MEGASSPREGGEFIFSFARRSSTPEGRLTLTSSLTAGNPPIADWMVTFPYLTQRWNAMGAADRRRYQQEISAFIGLVPTPPTAQSSP